MILEDSLMEVSAMLPPTSPPESKNDKKVVNALLADVNAEMEGAKKMMNQLIGDVSVSQSAILPDLETNDNHHEELPLAVCNPNTELIPAKHPKEIFPRNSARVITASQLDPFRTPEGSDKNVRNISKTIRDSSVTENSPCETDFIAVVPKCADSPILFDVTMELSKSPHTSSIGSSAQKDETIKVTENDVDPPTSATEDTRNGIDPVCSLNMTDDECRNEIPVLPEPVRASEGRSLSCDLRGDAPMELSVQEEATHAQEPNNSEKDLNVNGLVSAKRKTIDLAEEHDNSTPNLVEKDFKPLENIGLIVDHTISLKSTNSEDLAGNDCPKLIVPERESTEKELILAEIIETTQDARSADTDPIGDLEENTVELSQEGANNCEIFSSIPQPETKNGLSDVPEGLHISNEANLVDLQNDSSNATKTPSSCADNTEKSISLPDVDIGVECVGNVNSVTDTIQSRSFSDSTHKSPSSFDRNSATKPVNDDRILCVTDPIQPKPCRSANENSTQSSVTDPESEFVGESQSKLCANIPRAPLDLSDESDSENADCADKSCAKSDTIALNREAAAIPITTPCKVLVSIFDPSVDLKEAANITHDPNTYSKNVDLITTHPITQTTSIFDPAMDLEDLDTNLKDLNSEKTPPPGDGSVTLDSNVNILNPAKNNEDLNSYSTQSDPKETSILRDDSIIHKSNINIIDSSENYEDPNPSLMDLSSKSNPTHDDGSITHNSGISISHPIVDSEEPGTCLKISHPKNMPTHESLIPRDSNASNICPGTDLEGITETVKDSSTNLENLPMISTPPVPKASIFDSRSDLEDSVILSTPLPTISSHSVSLSNPEIHTDHLAKHLTNRTGSKTTESMKKPAVLASPIPLNSNNSVFDLAATSEDPVKNPDISLQKVKESNTKDADHNKKLVPVKNSSHQASCKIGLHPVKVSENSCLNPSNTFPINNIKPIQNSSSVSDHATSVISKTKDHSSSFSALSPINLMIPSNYLNKTKEKDTLSSCSLFPDVEHGKKAAHEFGSLSLCSESREVTHTTSKSTSQTNLDLGRRKHSSRALHAPDPQCVNHHHPSMLLEPFKVPRVPSLDASDPFGLIPRNTTRKRDRKINNSSDEEVAFITSKIRRKIHTISRPLSPLPPSPVFTPKIKDIDGTNNVPANTAITTNTTNMDTSNTVNTGKNI